MGRSEFTCPLRNLQMEQKRRDIGIFRHLSYDDSPIWKFHVQGVELQKEIGMTQEENTVAVRYTIWNRQKKDAVFRVTPFFQFTRKGSEPKSTQVFTLERDTVYSEGMTLYFEQMERFVRSKKKRKSIFIVMMSAMEEERRGLQRPIMKSVFLYQKGNA